MSEKCDANCDARFPSLWLRNNIFYYRVELNRVNGKRRYKRISLHTSNFYEAREKLRIMNSSDNQFFNDLRQLISGLLFEESQEEGGIFALKPKFGRPRHLSRFNKKEKIEEILLKSAVAKQMSTMALSSEDRELLKKLDEILPLCLEFLKNMSSPQIKTPAPSRTILEILDNMLLKGNNCKTEQIRKRNAIIRLLKEVGLTVQDDYAKFHNSETFGTIARNIVENPETKGDMKRKLIRCIKELATCGSNIDPDNYKSSLVLNLPKIEKTKKYERKPHLPYSKNQLLEIFNPAHSYFKSHPDAFYVCLIALYTGARANSAITLQYDDIIEKDGMPCIQFIENHPLKQLKNEASERIVPIHSQLIKAGFLDYVKQNKAKLKAKGTDFIFPKCQTKQGKYNNKYTVRVLLSFFTQIGVKAQSKDGLDFHSFRKNASIAMQDAGIGQTYINDIIGWEGKTTMEQSYSNHNLIQIKQELEKFRYDFLETYLIQWKKRLIKG